MNDYIIAATVFILGAAASIGYVIWLDSGCELTGVMTWQGKVCLENLN
jgi:hypothetical protein